MNNIKASIDHGFIVAFWHPEGLRGGMELLLGTFFEGQSTQTFDSVLSTHEL